MRAPTILQSMGCIRSLPFLLCLLTGCGDDTSPGESTEPTPDEACPPGTTPIEFGECEAAGLPADALCNPGEVFVAEACEPAGLPADMPCPPGHRQDAGGCRAAGMEPGDCDEGFAHDGDRSCEPILPEAPCPDGSMAVPGETSCREVQACGSGTWGDIATDASTQHVDATYLVGDSDGTSAKPWPTVQQGVDAAEPNGLVAIAAGTYAEDVSISQPVRIEGRCPSMVTIVGQAELGAIALVGGSDGSWLGGFAVTGPEAGVGIYSGDVVLERLWLHDLGNAGIGVLPGGSAQITDSLLEYNGTTNAYAESSQLSIESCVLRGALPHPVFQSADGIVMAKGAALQLRRSVVETSTKVGIRTDDSSAEIDGSVVRLNQGRGIRIVDGPGASISGCAVRGNGTDVATDDSGINVRGALVTIERTVVGDNGGFGGIFLLDSEGGPGVIEIDDSVVEGNERFGVATLRSGLQARGLLLRDQVPEVVDGSGIGLDAFGGAVSLQGSIIERSYFAGIRLSEGTLVVEDSLVRDTQVDEATGLSVGIFVGQEAAPTTLTLRRSILERNRGAGLAIVGARGEVDRSLILATEPNDRPNALLSTFNVFVSSAVDMPADAPRAELRILGSRVAESAGSGVAVLAADLALTDSVIADNGTAPETPLGVALFAQDEGGIRADVTLEGTVVEGSVGTGIFAASSDIRVDRSIVRNTRVDATGASGEGIFVARRAGSALEASLTLTQSLVENNHVAGVLLAGASGLIDRSVIRDTHADAQNLFGDAISAVPNEDGVSSVVSVIDSRVEASTRAAVAVFGGELEYGGTVLSCQSFDLVGEEDSGTPFTVRPLGRNGCGCEEIIDQCLLESPGLEAPTPAPPPVDL